MDTRHDFKIRDKRYKKIKEIYKILHDTVRKSRFAQKAFSSLLFDELAPSHKLPTVSLDNSSSSSSSSWPSFLFSL
jgi:hypothetical protein